MTLYEVLNRNDGAVSSAARRVRGWKRNNRHRSLRGRVENTASNVGWKRRGTSESFAQIC